MHFPPVKPSADQDLEIKGRGGGGGERVLPTKKFFRPFGLTLVQIKGRGPSPPGPSPASATETLTPPPNTNRSILGGDKPVLLSLPRYCAQDSGHLCLWTCSNVDGTFYNWHHRDQSLTTCSIRDHSHLLHQKPSNNQTKEELKRATDARCIEEI